VRLPLQILLESPFGELNENQEELLRDARAAADAIDAALRKLGHVADIDRNAFPVQQGWSGQRRRAFGSAAGASAAERWARERDRSGPGCHASLRIVRGSRRRWRCL
jgi:hypothetical protein